jgi:hypothetical protein
MRLIARAFPSGVFGPRDLALARARAWDTGTTARGAAAIRDIKIFLAV